jgi:hypothetical protein
MSTGWKEEGRRSDRREGAVAPDGTPVARNAEGILSPDGRHVILICA